MDIAVVHTNPTVRTAETPDVAIKRMEAIKRSVYDTRNMIPMIMENRGRTSTNFIRAAVQIFEGADRRREVINEFFQTLSAMNMRSNHELISEAEKDELGNDEVATT